MIAIEIASCSIFAQSGNNFLSNTDTLHLFSSRDLNVDFKFIDPEKGYFGIDYKLNLKREFRTQAVKDSNYFKPNISLNLNSTGFVTVRGESNSQNSIINELNFELSPIFKQKKYTGRVLSIEEELKMTDDEIIELTMKQAAMLQSPFWLMFNVHGKHETTQDFKNYDVAVGGSMTLTTSYLNGILDIPFSLLRTKKHNNPRHLDLNLSLDYVTNLDKTESASIRSENNANRLNFNIEWETGIFERERITFLYSSFHELNSPVAVEDAGIANNYFYMIKLEHPIGKSEDGVRKTVSIKYTQGALPPNFNKGYVLGGGFNMEF